MSRRLILLLAAILLALPASFFLAFAALLEPIDYAFFQPATYLAAILLTAVAAILFAASSKTPRVLPAIAAFLLFTLIALTLSLTTWGPRKKFLHHLAQVRPGMSLADVDRIMAPYPRGAAATPAGPVLWSPIPPPPSPTLIVFRHDITNATYDADIALITLDHNTVTAISFDQD